MKIVIDIHEKDYQAIKSGYLPFGAIVYAIANGKLLPEHCGRLIDADSLIKTIEEKAKRLSNVDTINGLCGAVALIFDEPTIIEAEGSDDE